MLTIFAIQTSSNHQQPFVYPMGDAKDGTIFLLLNVENTFQVTFH